MGTIELELFGKVPSYLGIAIQILSAIIFGGMVGYDREKKMKAAGLKTNILICLGATLYTIMSILHIKGLNVAPVDPNRVGAQIVSGIGFLGAGAIIQGKGSVVGMTTAATIWVVAAIGYTIGIGYPVSAGLFSFTVLVVLKWINPIYNFIERSSSQEFYVLKVLSLGTVKKSALAILETESIEILEVYEEEIDKKRMALTIRLHGHARAVDRLTNEFNHMVQTEKVSVNQIDINFKKSERDLDKAS